VPGRTYRYKTSNGGGGNAVATLLDYEQRGEVTDVNGPAYFQYQNEDVDQDGDGGVAATTTLPFVETDSQPSFDVEEEGSDDDSEMMDDLLAKAEEEAAKAAAAAEAAAAEAKRKEG